MKILGTKFFGQEASVYFLDTSEKKIFAMNSDRVSRIKKDTIDIQPILRKYGKTKFSNIDVLSFPFNTFDGRDAHLVNSGTSYYWLKMQEIIRKFTKPVYRSDLNRKQSFIEKLYLFLFCIINYKYFYYWILRNFYWKKYLKGELSEIFNKNKINDYINEVMNKYQFKIKKIEYQEHHTTHAYSAYYHSPFAYKEQSLVFTLDEHGDGYHSKLFLFEPNKTTLLGESQIVKFWINGKVNVTSIAGMYSNFTEAMDLVRSSEEGKVEAIAAYGKPDNELLGQLFQMVSIRNFAYEINFDIFKKLSDIEYLKSIRTKIGDENFCATIQFWLEEVSVDYLNKAHEKFKVNNLCLAGGAVANVIMNYKIWERTPFKNLFIVPPMGDEGAAAGAAIMTAINAGENLEWLKDQYMPYYGPSFNKSDVMQSINKFNNLKFEDLKNNWEEYAAKSVANNKVIGIFHGKMEFGPRALGNRSIIANAADVEARDKINAKIKKRPAYQPFCPSVLEEERERLFENSFSHKHMATAFLIKDKFRDILSSGTHIDGTARPQFVEQKDNPTYYKLIKEVQKLTGFGMVINTSFNLHGRTIVDTPEDAIRDFLDCGIDELFIEGIKIYR